MPPANRKPLVLSVEREPGGTRYVIVKSPTSHAIASRYRQPTVNKSSGVDSIGKGVRRSPRRRAVGQGCSHSRDGRNVLALRTTADGRPLAGKRTAACSATLAAEAASRSFLTSRASKSGIGSNHERSGFETPHCVFQTFDFCLKIIDGQVDSVPSVRCYIVRNVADLRRRSPRGVSLLGRLDMGKPLFVGIGHHAAADIAVNFVAVLALRQEGSISDLQGFAVPRPGSKRRLSGRILDSFRNTQPV